MKKKRKEKALTIKLSPKAKISYSPIPQKGAFKLIERIYGLVKKRALYIQL